jgi:signal transduction histidine kinase
MNSLPLRILIADDDEGDRRQIKRAVRQSGLNCECIETVSTERALELCGQTEFDCVIMDYRLPGQDGLAGISAMHERFAHLPIIMSTGHGDEMVAADAIKRGASDYIPKTGVNPSSIRKTIAAAIEKAALMRKVRQQEEELENFARILVHDLRAPTISIAGFAQIIQEELDDGNPEEARKCSVRVMQAAQRMGQLIDTLRQYTLADAIVPFEPVSMEQVVADTLVNLTSLIAGRDAEVSAGALPTVVGNAAQLGQLVQNLIVNGIKYCDAPVPRIRVAAEQAADGRWLISVEDNGIGIPEKHLKKVFEPLMRLGGAEKCEGTGLGLATCKRIAERHGSAIWCRSNAGPGATFFFTLAAVQAGTPLEEPLSEPLPTTQPLARSAS